MQSFIDLAKAESQKCVTFFAQAGTHQLSPSFEYTPKSQVVLDV